MTVASELDLALSIVLGIGLAAATGFRVFIPLLVVSLAAHGGYLHLNEGLDWLGTTLAMITFGVAAVVEVLAYYVPGVDNLLDLIATPAALAAGTVITAAVLTDVSPLVKWTTAVIAGGGAAGLAQGVTALLRAKSTVATGGLGNPIVATGELGGSVILSVLAVFAPILALILLVLSCWLIVRLARRLVTRSAATEPPAG